MASNIPPSSPELRKLSPKIPWIVEIAHDTNEDLEAITQRFTHTIDTFRRLADVQTT